MKTFQITSGDWNLSIKADRFQFESNIGNFIVSFYVGEEVIAVYAMVAGACIREIREIAASAAA